MNAFINEYRKNKRVPAPLSGDDGERGLLYRRTVERTPEPSAEDRVLESLPDEAVQAALASLPEQFRVAVLLADVEALSYREIAKLTGVPIGTVMSSCTGGGSPCRGGCGMPPRRRKGTQIGTPALGFSDESSTPWGRRSSLRGAFRRCPGPP